MQQTQAIEFGLPNGAGGMAAAYSAGTLRTKLYAWANRHNRNIVIGTTNHDHRRWITVEFESESDLTLFALSWDEKSFMGWQRINTRVKD